MSDYQLKAVPALGNAKHRPIEIGGYRLEENSDLALASISTRNGGNERVASIFKELLGCAPPGPGAFSVGQGGLQAFWTSPDQWIVSAPHDGHERLARDLKQSFKETASITEQNDAWVCLEISGADLVPILERLATFDSQDLQ